jgi:hypothetical protein
MTYTATRVENQLRFYSAKPEDFFHVSNGVTTLRIPAADIDNTLSPEAMFDAIKLMMDAGSNIEAHEWPLPEGFQIPANPNA